MKMKEIPAETLKMTSSGTPTTPLEEEKAITKTTNNYGIHLCEVDVPTQQWFAFKKFCDENEVRVNALELSYGDLLWSLEDMLNQHCSTSNDGTSNTGGLSANAMAARILAAAGRIVIHREYGRMVVFTWVEEQPHGNS